jgi:hypothetical protein
MALTKEDFVGAVARLNDLTRLQVIKWTPCNTPQKPATGLAFNELLRPDLNSALEKVE